MKLIPSELYFSIIFFTSLLAGILNPADGNAQNAEKSAYLFAYFTGNGSREEAIRFALSDDGYSYKALNNNEPVLNAEAISATGGVRDPHILHGQDGKTVYMVATDMQVAKYDWGPNYGLVMMKSKSICSKRPIPWKGPEFLNTIRANTF